MTYFAPILQLIEMVKTNFQVAMVHTKMLDHKHVMECFTRLKNNLGFRRDLGKASGRYWAGKFL